MQHQQTGVEDTTVNDGVRESGDDPIDRSAVRVTIDVDGRRLVYDESDVADLSLDW